MGDGAKLARIIKETVEGVLCGGSVLFEDFYDLSPNDKVIILKSIGREFEEAAMMIRLQILGAIGPCDPCKGLGVIIEPGNQVTDCGRCKDQHWRVKV